MCAAGNALLAQSNALAPESLNIEYAENPPSDCPPEIFAIIYSKLVENFGVIVTVMYSSPSPLCGGVSSSGTVVEPDARAEVEDVAKFTIEPAGNPEIPWLCEARDELVSVAACLQIESRISFRIGMFLASKLITSLVFGIMIL
jgi:hypothetical protein